MHTWYNNRGREAQVLKISANAQMYSRDAPVFDLEQIADDTVGGAALHKVLAGGKKALRVGRTVLPHDVVLQGHLRVPPNLMERHSVRHQLDQATVRPCHYDLQWPKPQLFHLLLTPDSLKGEKKGKLVSHCLKTDAP